MVKVTNRQRQIIKILLQRKGEMTTAEIAQQLQVSTRTIHRSLHGVDSVLQRFGASLSRKTGSGIQLVADDDQLRQLRAYLAQLKTLPRTSLERMLLLLCTLLELREPIKLFTLSHELHSAIPTISQDLDQLARWMEKRSLKLVRRRGYGVEIKGSEADKRKAIAFLADQHLDHSVLFASDHEYSDPVSNKLAQMVGKEHFLKLEKLLWNWDEHDPAQMSEEAYTNVLIRLSLAVKRFMEGFVLTYVDGKFNADAQHIDKLYAWFTQEMNLSLPRHELNHIAKLLADRGSDDSEQLAAPEDLKILHFVGQLIQKMSDRLDYPLEQDQALREGLLQHSQQAFARLYDEEPIRNPLLTQIRMDYDELLSHVQSAIEEMEDAPDIPDSEAAYLVLHFGAAIERIRQASLQVRALLVCTSGIGSSKMLAARLTKEFPQIDILGNISWYEASRIPQEQYDVLISTVDLPLPKERYIKLSPLLSEDETEKLQMFIRDKGGVREAPGGSRHRKRPTLSKLSSVANLSQAVIQIIRRFSVLTLTIDRAQVSLSEFVYRMCDSLQRTGIMNTCTLTAKRLLEEERNRAMVIPDSPLVFFHTRSPDTNEPVFILFRTNEPFKIERLSSEPLTHTLLMIAPEGAEPWTYEALSEFSALLLQAEAIDGLLSGDEDDIRTMFTNHLEQAILNKLGME